MQASCSPPPGCRGAGWLLDHDVTVESRRLSAPEKGDFSKNSRILHFAKMCSFALFFSTDKPVTVTSHVLQIAMSGGKRVIWVSRAKTLRFS